MTSDTALIEVPLRWSDMDAYGHVNNTQFLRVLEEARVIGMDAWFRGLGVLRSGILVTRHEIEYLAPLDHRVAPIQVRMWVTRIRPVGFDLGYEVLDSTAPDAPCYARAETGLVLYDFDRAAPRRMTPPERQVLAPHQGGPVAFRWSR